MKNYSLKGVKTYKLKILPDERGFFTEALRKDWKELLKDEWITQANMSYSYPNVIRAWHKHLRGQTDYFLLIKGALKICAYDDENQELDEVISTNKNLQIVRVPGHYWHGFKVLGNERAFLLYFTTKLYDYKNPDEQRRLWNDPTIIPKLINGTKDDPRVGKPWDWNYPPYK